MTQLISCQLHDYVEVACLYRYPVRLLLRNGKIVEGCAVDVVSDRERREYLLLDNDQTVELGVLKRLEVLQQGARFQVVDF